MTEEQAMGTAKRFARAVGMEWTDDHAYGRFRGPTGASPAVWMIATAVADRGAVVYHVDAGGNYVCYAHTPLDSARRTSAVELSPDEAMERAARAVEATGVTRDQFALRMLALECDPRSGAQRWRVEWERVLGGERVSTLAVVFLNAESGALLQMMTAGLCGVPADLAIDRQEAIRLALEAGAKVLGTARVEIDGLPQLRLVSPDDPLLLDEADALRSTRPRKAWVAAVSTRRGANRMSHLWIDANDGSLLGRRGYGQEEVAGEGHRARWDPEAGRSALPANAASGFLAAAIAGMAAVAIIVLVVLWPRRGRVAPSDG